MEGKKQGEQHNERSTSYPCCVSTLGD